MKRNRIFRRAAALGMALLIVAGMLPAGFVQPAEAAEVSNLTPKAIMEYYDNLSSRYMMDTVVLYAGLRDMDGDQIPELIVVSANGNDDIASFGEHGYPNALVEIWTMKNGALTKSNSVWSEALTNNNMSYVSRNGTLYIEVYTCYTANPVLTEYNTYIGMDNYVEEFYRHEETPDFSGITLGTYTHSVNGASTDITEAEYYQYQMDYGNIGVEAIADGWWSWYSGYGNHSSFYDVQQQLADRMSVFAVPTPSSKGFGA